MRALWDLSCIFRETLFNPVSGIEWRRNQPGELVAYAESKVTRFAVACSSACDVPRVASCARYSANTKENRTQTGRGEGNDTPAVNGPFADEGQPHRERPEHDGNGVQNHGQHSSKITNSFCWIDNLRVLLSDVVCRSRSKQTLPVRDKGLQMGLLRLALRIRSP